MIKNKKLNVKTQMYQLIILWMDRMSLKRLLDAHPSKHPTLYDVIIWLVLGWLVNNQKLTLVQRHYLIRIQRYNQSCRH